MEGPNGVTIALADETSPAGDVQRRADGPGTHVALIWGAAALSVATAVLSVVIYAATTRGDYVDLVLFEVSSLVLLAVGLLVGLRRPGNLIGPFLLGQALLMALNGLAEPYARYGLIDHPGSLPAASFAALYIDAGWPTIYAGLVAVALVFPDGHLPSPRWRPIAVGATIAFVGLLTSFLVEPAALSEPFENVERPLATLPESFPPIWVPFWLGTLASLFAAAFAVRSRFRRSMGVERLQLLWLAYGALLIPGALLLCVLDYAVTGDAGLITGFAVMVMSLAVPISIAIAIFRYQLFDIELILSRTLIYGALTACVVAVYVAIVGGLNSFIDSRGALGLVATGIVAAGVQPLRLRLQARANRLVYGDRDDPYVGLSRLGDRLQTTLAPESVTASIVEAVAEALRVSYVAIEFERDGEFEVVAAHGTERGGEKVSTPLAYQGQTIGRLVVEPPPGRELSAADRRLLADLALHAGVALHGVRLTADLQRSRERLVSTREEERRRLRRDLHDSLGPTLAGMAFSLDAARNLIETDPEGASRMIGELRGETQEAIGDIRRVAHELRPPALDELGFVSAIRTHAERLSANGSHLRVRVEAPEPFPALPAAAEVAGYRIALEALTNVGRHADARACRVGLAVDRRELRVEVADDGVGLEAGRGAGVGLTSMGERAAELGGTLEIGPREGGGTRVTAALPIGEGWS